MDALLNWDYEPACKEFTKSLSLALQKGMWHPRGVSLAAWPGHACAPGFSKSTELFEHEQKWQDQT